MGLIFFLILFMSVLTNVLDLSKLNLDPVPEFGSNLDPDPGLCYQF